MKFQILRGKSTTQPYYWRIVAANGQTLAVSENYVAKASVESAIESVIRGATTATVDDLS